MATETGKGPGMEDEELEPGLTASCLLSCPARLSSSHSCPYPAFRVGRRRLGPTPRFSSRFCLLPAM